MITITLDKSAQQTRVKMSGELDIVATTNQTEELNNVLALADKALEIDCTDLEYISSAGLRFFMQLKRESEAKGGSIRLTHLNEDVADIFRMSGFKNIFEIE
ncbi:MAG: STAS domain-containing protein [Paludibacteraceae bacterium]|nr:STAS domain-containing protein [Paludibacteraceae bacterium]